MSFFLLKPHVVGPEGNVTSPDVIVDHLFIDGEPAPVDRISHEAWQQVRPAETARAAYGIMALGGGALILPAVVLGSGTVVAARAAWRLSNLDGHVNSVQLNGTPLGEIGSPERLISAAGGAGDTLPRGYLLVQTSAGNCVDADLARPGARPVPSPQGCSGADGPGSMGGPTGPNRDIRSGRPSARFPTSSDFRSPGRNSFDSRPTGFRLRRLGIQPDACH